MGAVIENNRRNYSQAFNKSLFFSFPFLPEPRIINKISPILLNLLNKREYCKQNCRLVSSLWHRICDSQNHFNYEGC